MRSNHGRRTGNRVDSPKEARIFVSTLRVHLEPWFIKRQLSRCPDIPAFFVSPLRVHLEPWFGDAVADSAFVGLLWGCQPGFLSVGHDLNAKYHHAMTLMTGTMANKHQSGLCPVRRRMLIAGMKTIRNETSMKAGE